jgi:predicted DNA-binding antitoxin AbrB/MazE fold protein
VNQQRAMLDLNQGEELPVKLRALNDEIRKAKAGTKETSDKVKEIDRSN